MSQKCNSSDHSGNVCCGDCDSGCGCEVTIANGGRNIGFGADGADASHGPYNYDYFSVGDVGSGGGDGVGGVFQGAVIMLLLAAVMPALVMILPLSMVMVMMLPW